MSSTIEVRVNARMWSRTVSLRPTAARLGGVRTIRDKGDALYSTSGARLKRTAPEYYLSTEETRTSAEGARVEVARFVRLLQGEPSIAILLDQGTLEAVVWVAIFADEGVASIDDLNIDMSPFGPRLGLVVDNFTEFDAEGVPVKLLIGPAANRKSA